jgi:hypothetical protein
MLASPDMQKNRTDECIATGLYKFLVKSISFSVAAAICCLAEISSERTFEDDRILIAVSSSNMFPWKEKNLPKNSPKLDYKKKRLQTVRYKTIETLKYSQ